MQRNKHGGGALLTVKRTVLERRDKGYRVKAVDSSTRFVALVRGCECLKNSQVERLYCRRVLTTAALRCWLKNQHMALESLGSEP